MMQKTSIPGRCYDASFYMLEALDEQPMLGNAALRLCHGIAVQTKPPHARMGHAWVEATIGDIHLVMDHQYAGAFIDAVRYYRVGQINPATVRRYTLAEARQMLDKHEFYGPWDEQILLAAHADETEALSRIRQEGQNHERGQGRNGRAKPRRG